MGTRSGSSERFFQLIPALDSLRRYNFVDARADAVAGLTVAAVAVPQAMAYAMVAGLPVEYGLYTAIVMTTVGALFDSSRQLINGPTNAISIAVFSVIASIDGPDQRIQMAVLLAFMVGSIQLGISLLRLGDLTRYISHSVIVGFTAGASGLLVLDQMKNLLGLKAMGGAHDHFLYRFWLTMTQGGHIHGPTVAIGLGSIAFVLALRWLKALLGWRLLPDYLIVVAAMAALVAQLRLDQQGVSVIGTIPASLPAFRLPVLDASAMREYSTGALAIALLGLLEAISMAKAIAAQTRQKLDMNQQCLSEALANLAGSTFQCMPGSGSLTRSAINQQTGASTQWSGVVSAVAVALIMMVFAPYAKYIPRAALAGILMLTAWKMVDRRVLMYHVRSTRFDAAIVTVTAFAAIAISVEFCVLIGVLMSFMLTVPRAGRMLRSEFVVTPQGGIRERLPGDEVCGRMLIFGFEGELFFGASSALERHFQHIENRLDPKTHVVVLRMKRVRNPDAVGLTLLEGFLERMKTSGVHVVMCGVRNGLYETMKKSGLADRLGDNEVFLEQPVQETSTLLAIRHAYDLIEDRCPTCPRRNPTTREAELHYMI
ncbi:MAG TPA: SulP family inorganic anion transporter [Candidatus Acidoferrales bacterium]|nr:SulP family inorganic anion transporter [Candidatus Acidoferrales bacterium]